MTIRKNKIRIIKIYFKRKVLRMTKTVGLLVMAYGTPYKESDIEPYYTDIRHGKRPTEEELQDLKIVMNL